MRLFGFIAVVVSLPCCSSVVTHTTLRRGSESTEHDVAGAVVVNGERMKVDWSDGDSFTFVSGKYSGLGSRLVGYNTLESYGPVHRWGGWTREELYAIAKKGADVAATKEWQCTSNGEEDAYKRVLVDCPDLAMHMVKTGNGLAYAVHGRPTPVLLDAMHQAQRGKRGVWAKGVPKGLITALHSFAENEGTKYTTSSNRILDTRTGEAPLRKHTDTYALCEEVCIETDGDSSCMVYVPFERRYKNQPPCLLPSP